MTTEALDHAPTVRIIDEVPPLEGLPPVEKPVIRQGEPIHFDIDVICEPGDEFGKKRAILPSKSPQSPSFEILSDEAIVMGGHDTAPSPLGYFTAGFALCLMTHIMGYLRFVPLNVTKVKLEVRGKYWSELGHIHKGGQGKGGGESFETFVIVESDEPPEKLREFVELCEQACVASQTLAKAIPGSVSIKLNGEKI